MHPPDAKRKGGPWPDDRPSQKTPGSATNSARVHRALSRLPAPARRQILDRLAELGDLERLARQPGTLAEAYTK